MRSLLALALAAFACALGAAAARGGAVSDPRPVVVSATDAPAHDGEIYAVSLAGGRRDLTNSPFADRQPLPSPDGSRVAFLSDRTGREEIWSVRSGGGGLTQLSRGLPQETQPIEVGWSPDGRKLLVAAGHGSSEALWVLQAGASQRRVTEAYPAGTADVVDAAWSPDSREIAYFASGSLRVITPGGRLVFTSHVLTASAGPLRVSWSAGNVLAALSGSDAAMVDAAGRTLAHFAAQAVEWSPDGSLLASMDRAFLEVRDDGGRLVLRKRLFPTALVEGIVERFRSFQPQLAWRGNGRVLVANVDLRQQLSGPASSAATPNVAVAVPSGRTSKLSRAAWFAASCDCASPDGSRIIRVARSGPRFVLRLSRPDGSSARVVAQLPTCASGGGSVAGVLRVRFAGDGVVVYDTACRLPGNLWLLDPETGATRRVTDEVADQTAPAWAPDGSRFAYVQAASLDCRGCPTGIWTRDAAGGDPRQLTPAIDSQWDTSPSFSPDSATVVFSHATIDGPGLGELYTVPVGGGASRDLGVAGAEPAWGPEAIAYEGDDGVWTMAPDGTGARLVIANASRPTWSRDGKLAALAVAADGTAFTAVVLDHGVTTACVLPFGLVRSLSWSEDGTRLLVAARPGRTGPTDVWSVQPDGGDLRRLTTNLDALAAAG